MKKRQSIVANLKKTELSMTRMLQWAIINTHETNEKLKASAKKWKIYRYKEPGELTDALTEI